MNQSKRSCNSNPGGDATALPKALYDPFSTMVFTIQTREIQKGIVTGQFYSRAQMQKYKQNLANLILLCVKH